MTLEAYRETACGPGHPGRYALSPPRSSRMFKRSATRFSSDYHRATYVKHCIRKRDVTDDGI